MIDMFRFHKPRHANEIIFREKGIYYIVKFLRQDVPFMRYLCLSTDTKIKVLE